jgi:hypothetical protein
MPRRSRPCLLSFTCFVVISSFPVVSLAQYKEIDSVGDEFARTLTESHSGGKVIAVADLRDPSGTANYQGHYFALFLTSAINFHRKGAPEVAEHNSFDDALSHAEISPVTLTASKSLTQIAETIHADIVVVGDFARDADTYSLHLSAIRTVDGVVLPFHRNQAAPYQLSRFSCIAVPSFRFREFPETNQG